MATHKLKDHVSMLENFVGAPMTDDVVSLEVQAYEIKEAHAKMKVLFDGLTANMLHLTDNLKAQIDEIKNDISVNIKSCIEEMDDRDYVVVRVQLDKVEGDLS
ncbi:hypothetical protein Fot_37672 [Forsythia ovata]|uniref:Uncharacterized protein n=1 Tax=Forsythia ovata TaxID=205694 RepID=A0ABD1RZP2_9LAMI